MKKTSKVLLIVGFFLTMSFFSFGQTQVTKNTEKKAAKEGTYQIIQLKNPLKKREVFTTDIYYTIEENREQTTEKTIFIGKYTKVRILPYSVIDAIDFVPLQSEFIFE